MQQSGEGRGARAEGFLCGGLALLGCSVAAHCCTTTKLRTVGPGRIERLDRHILEGDVVDAAAACALLETDPSRRVDDGHVGDVHAVDISVGSSVVRELPNVDRAELDPG